MTVIEAAALSGAVCGTLTGLVLDVLRKRFLVGPPRSRRCRKCWCFAVVLMDGWDACLRCGDAAWHRDLDVYTATTDRSNLVAPVRKTRFELLRGGRPETKP